MPEPLQVYTAMVVGASAVLIFGLAVLSYIQSRSLGEDVLRSRMFLKSHLLRRGYLILIFAAVGALFLSVPMTLGEQLPWPYLLGGVIFVMGSLNLAVFYFFFLVARWKSPLAALLGRTSELLGGTREDDAADDR